jgi:hypothetical protein
MQRVMPWRNGGGSTREVAIDPPDARAGAPFRWRISRASVASDSPFSIFPGVDRSLWLLRGNGLLLDVAGREVRLERPLQRFDFAGETPVHARLLAGAIEDLNVFVARGSVTVDAQVLTLAADQQETRTLPRGTSVLLALEGGLAVTGMTAAPTIFHTGDAVRIDADAETTFGASPAGAATILLASFVPSALPAT